MLWIALGAPLWAGWTQFALALLGVIGAGVAAAQLVDAELIKGTTAEELAAAAIGLQLPFYGAVAFVALLMATQVTDPIV